MSKISITCTGCGVTFDKRKADVNKERKKNPQCNFYCSLSCLGRNNTSHLSSFDFSKNSDLQQHASLLGRGKNRKYHGRDLPFSMMIRKCRGRKHEFSLTVEFLGKLWDSQNGKCALSNIDLDLYSTSYVDMPSVDRIDSSIGYIPSNVQIVSCALNLAKASMSNEDALKLIRLIRESQ